MHRRVVVILSIMATHVHHSHPLAIPAIPVIPGHPGHPGPARVILVRLTTTLLCMGPQPLPHHEC